MDMMSYLLGKKSGGGSGGTTDYSQLENKPSINGVILNGNKTAEDLGLAEKEYVDDLVGDINAMMDLIVTVDEEEY